MEFTSPFNSKRRRVPVNDLRPVSNRSTGTPKEVAAANAAKAFKRLCKPGTSKLSSPTFLPFCMIKAEDDVGSRITRVNWKSFSGPWPYVTT